MNTEKASTLVEKVVTKFYAKYEKEIIIAAPNITVDERKRKISLFLDAFLKHPNLLMLDENLLKDKQSIPSMFWRSKNAPPEFLGCPEKLLSWFLEKKCIVDGVIGVFDDRLTNITRYESSPRIIIDFRESRDVSYTGIRMSCEENLSSTVEFDTIDDVDISSLGCLAEENGDFFEIEWDTADYNHDYMDFSDSDNSELEIESVTYFDSEGNSHVLDLSSYPDNEEIMSACLDIEESIDRLLD